MPGRIRIFLKCVELFSFRNLSYQVIQSNTWFLFLCLLLLFLLIFLLLVFFFLFQLFLLFSLYRFTFPTFIKSNYSSHNPNLSHRYNFARIHSGSSLNRANIVSFFLCQLPIYHTSYISLFQLRFTLLEIGKDFLFILI